ncbi:hypothetical protein [Halalkalibacter hemicellulosilyticus]|uniref:Uncharacterized protein n=1 Tax=Halalkalibacter hemicellulosilyticusJCM 9152 TaxID=1236971 RepID=W4QHN0_9BACI|nr:hypothetical protein [Halalkalibacter hemicellulosilyticus]GAE31620.1 hypothetical protein JCM9152_3098 [Halalkalibacter hemicellulosilyticusJCM 9152]
MATKVIMLAILFLSLMINDYSKLKKKKRKIIIIYLAIVAITIYLSADFIFILNMYDLTDLLHDILFQPANQIVDWMVIE